MACGERLSKIINHIRTIDGMFRGIFYLRNRISSAESDHIYARSISLFSREPFQVESSVYLSVSINSSSTSTNAAIHFVFTSCFQPHKSVNSNYVYDMKTKTNTRMNTQIESHYYFRCERKQWNRKEHASSPVQRLTSINDWLILLIVNQKLWRMLLYRAIPFTIEIKPLIDFPFAGAKFNRLDFRRLMSAAHFPPAPSLIFMGK